MIFFLIDTNLAYFKNTINISKIKTKYFIPIEIVYMEIEILKNPNKNCLVLYKKGRPKKNHSFLFKNRI